MSVRSPLGKGKGGALRTAFWERVVFWVPGARHSLASRLRLSNVCARTEKGPAVPW